MTRRRGRLQPESLPELLAALGCRQGWEGTDLPGTRLRRLNELLTGYDEGLVPDSVSGRKTDASPSGGEFLARSRSSAKSLQAANYDMRQAGCGDNSERGFCDSGDSVHEG